MIVEMRTDILRPRSLQKVEDAYAAALPNRAKLSRLGGFWRTEVGPLNQLFHFWPYKDAAERSDILSEADKISDWPPRIGDHLLAQESKTITLAPFSLRLEPAQFGEVYELRIYTYLPGEMPKIIEDWSKIIEERSKISPLVMAGYTDTGTLNEWVHLWAYKDMGERKRLRQIASASPFWPVPSKPIKQQNLIMTPTELSPLQ